MPNLSHDMIRKMAKTEEDKDVLMSAQLDPYNTLVPTVSSAQLRATGAVLPGSSQKYQQPDQDLQCSYDPIATLKVVEAMLKNPCVQSIQIPDPFIINKLNSSKVIYRPFVDNDRFVVDTGFIECGGG